MQQRCSTRHCHWIFSVLLITDSPGNVVAGFRDALAAVAPYVDWLTELNHPSGTAMEGLSPKQREQAKQACMLAIGDHIASSTMDTALMWTYVAKFTHSHCSHEGLLAQAYLQAKQKHGRLQAQSAGAAPSLQAVDSAAWHDAFVDDGIFLPSAWSINICRTM
jgi:hypothetical protein